jgi:hypothetical protein
MFEINKESVELVALKKKKKKKKKICVLFDQLIMMISMTKTK